MTGKLNIAFVEPHLEAYGGIRRVIELGNQLIEQGHAVTYLLPAGRPLVCDWIACRGEIRHIDGARRDSFDAVIFNHEPQWTEVMRFPNAKLLVYFVLHYAVLYGKEGAWESYRCPVDLHLANSSWTADCVEAEIGIRPTVLVGGINTEHFRPGDHAKTYQVLAMGGHDRPWKGTADIVEACRLGGLRLETFHGKGIEQTRMHLEYGKAEVFAQASWFEGFGQPGLEALACGIPLVTTDCGGARDYAIHEETALVVPTRDPAALAEALGRLLRDKALARRLSANGLSLVREQFSWARSARELAHVLECAIRAKQNRQSMTEHSSHGAVDPDPGDSPTLVQTPRYEPPGEAPIDRPEIRARFEAISSPTEVAAPADGPHPLVSIIALSWEQRHLTEAFVASVRANTDAPYELILVDNGSCAETQEYVRGAADIAVLNEENLGFAAGHNKGLAVAKGEYIVFLNNDTRVPPGWLPKLLASASAPDVGIVASAVTNANGWVSVRRVAGERVHEILPFTEPPPAVCYLMRRSVVDELGGWSEDYKLGSGEDIDLCFTAWVHGYRLLLDERVLVEHVGKGTAGTMLEDWRSVWKQNKEQFYRKWILEDVAPPAVPGPGVRGGSAERLAQASEMARSRREADQLREQLAQLEERAREDRRRFASILLQYKGGNGAPGARGSSSPSRDRLVPALKRLVLNSPAGPTARRVWRNVKRLRSRTPKSVDLVAHSRAELQGLNEGRFAFLDAGTSKGGGLSYCATVFGRGAGLGLDRDPIKVRQALENGCAAALCDLETIELSRGCVSFVSMMDFLEHLPDQATAERVLRNLSRAARDFLFIRHPSFEDVDYLRGLGLKLGWTDWSGHPNAMRMEDFRRMFERCGWPDYAIIAQKPIADSSHPAILAHDGPRNVVKYDRARHGPKPDVKFDKPVYTQFDLLVRLPGLTSDQEWQELLSALHTEDSSRFS